MLVIYYLVFSLIAIKYIDGNEKFREYTIQEIPKVLENSCLFIATSINNETEFATLRNISRVFDDDSNVKIGVLNQRQSYLDHPPEILGTSFSISEQNDSNFLFYPKKKVDRKCLLKPPREDLKMEHYSMPFELKSIVRFLNERCGTFRDTTGSLSHAGRMREFILGNLFKEEESHLGKIRNGKIGPVDFGSECERIPMPSKDEFIHKYLFRSKPVVITDALKNWPAMTKWTNEFLTTKFAQNEVRVAFAPNSEYEGCAKASDFEDYKHFKLPNEVKKKLPFPDLVVVRPAFLEMKFADFMTFLDKPHKSNETQENVSAYLEYSSIPTHLPQLENDVKEMPFISGILKRRHLNIWLSNGNTLGKLHFDPFDNFLCQLSGKKQVILYEPHDNTKLYEAHIQEAVLGYNSKTMSFRRKTLMDSTSMVMSPVNILKPDYNRFPKFKEVKAMNCTIDEGDVLYMPSFWWHEVQSFPNKHKPRNVAVNYWYEPFLTKEYPCQTCKLDINPFYSHLLK